MCLTAGGIGSAPLRCLGDLKPMVGRGNGPGVY